MKKIKFNIPNSNKFSKVELEKFQSNNNYIKGYYEKKCSEKIIKILDTKKKLLLTNSCTASLEIVALCIKNSKKYNKNSNIVLPSYTFSSTANAFLKFGFKLKFIDINTNNFMVDPDFLMKAIDINTIGFVNVYYGSHVNDINQILNICKKRKIYFIEDAAQAFGTKYKGKSVGSFGQFGCYSFHQTKNLHCGLGGALLLDSKYLKNCIMIHDRGTDRELVINKNINKKFYEWSSLGGSYANSEFNLQFLAKELYKFNKIIKFRRNIYNKYYFFFKKYENKLHLLNVSDTTNSNYHSFWIKFKYAKQANNFIKYMYKNDIECFIGYIPLHTSNFYIKNFKKTNLINTQNNYKKIVRMPFHNYLNEKDLNKILKFSKVFLDNK